MAPALSIRSFARFASVGCALAAACLLRDVPARACGGFSEPMPTDFMTFDPSITGDAENIFFDDRLIGFGGVCHECGDKAVAADWHAYFKGAVSDQDWHDVLLPEDANKHVAAVTRVGRSKNDHVKDALAYAELAAGVSQFTTLTTGGPTPPGDLMTQAQHGLSAARDGFMKQRYAFQVLRILFYQRDWRGAVAFYDRSVAALATPSQDLAWRSRYYVAGASRRAGNLPRANLELARIHASYGPLETGAAEDFQPMEESDWKATLALARDTRDKTMLWRAVGVKKDGIVAMQEIVKLDPKSDLLALLLVRELARAEPLASPVWGQPPEPASVAAQKKAFAVIEKVAQKIIATPGSDRPWISELVLGHIAAKRGDLAAARPHLDQAVALRPGDVKVAGQAKASLALALAATWKMDPAHETELANAMNTIGKDFGKRGAVNGEVRGKLARAYAQAGRIVDAEFLEPGTPEAKKKWHDRAFVAQMIARSEQAGTEFDKLVLASSLDRPQLERELAGRELLDGDFAAAAQAYQAKARSEQLHTNPFTLRIVDCHDCDHEKYDKAPWTHATVASRLAELARAASGSDEAAAAAALELGNALYNLTWFGNARVFLDGTRQMTSDTRAAERWYKRAYDLTKKPELKARAAWGAAKCELGRNQQLDVDQPWGGYGKDIAAPKTWFPLMKKLAATKYYREVLAECSRFRAYAGQ
jgi:hypothetical protein